MSHKSAHTKAQQRTLVEDLIKVFGVHAPGSRAELEYDPKTRTTRLQIAITNGTDNPALINFSTEFGIRGITAYLGHWYHAAQPMSADVVTSGHTTPNMFHFRKATTESRSWQDFLDEVGRITKEAVQGTLFATAAV